MTKKEAIKVLKKDLQIIDDPNVTMTASEWEEHDDHMRDALEMAIEALEKEETLQNLTKPNKSDLISRQAAIDALYDKGLSMTAWGELLAMKWSDIQTCIELLPSAQLFTSEQIQTMQELESAQLEKAYELGKADRPTGHWHIEPGIGCFCSKCSFDIGNDLDFMEYVHYCPNCGCAMKGGEEE